jgi:hypothetical protein
VCILNGIKSVCHAPHDLGGDKVTKLRSLQLGSSSVTLMSSRKQAIAFFSSDCIFFQSWLSAHVLLQVGKSQQHFLRSAQYWVQSAPGLQKVVPRHILNQNNTAVSFLRHLSSNSQKQFKQLSGNSQANLHKNLCSATHNISFTQASLFEVMCQHKKL